jgi:hypothetical protein
VLQEIIGLMILPLQIFIAIVLADAVRTYRVKRMWRATDDWEFENGITEEDYK